MSHPHDNLGPRATNGKTTLLLTAVIVLIVFALYASLPANTTPTLTASVIGLPSFGILLTAIAVVFITLMMIPGPPVGNTPGRRFGTLLRSWKTIPRPSMPIMVATLALLFLLWCVLRLG